MNQSVFYNRSLPTRAVHRWLLASVMILVLALGWKYPLLGFAVPVAMLGGMLGGVLRGRYVCGNLCPRGSFFDTFFAVFGPRREIPEFFYRLKLRWLILGGLMSLMVYRLAQNPSSVQHWGLVFWQMCLVTTLVALVAGSLFRPRSWCAICPVGTIGHVTGGQHVALQIAAECRECGKCEALCPMGHAIVEHKSAGMVVEPDCVQCSLCVNSCPVNALTLTDTAATCLREDTSEKRCPQKLSKAA